MLEWIAARLPHVQRGTGRLTCWRLYGLKPRFRLCLIDYTRGSFYACEAAWVRLQICGVAVYESNRHLSGLPGVRSNGR